MAGGCGCGGGNRLDSRERELYFFAMPATPLPMVEPEIERNTDSRPDFEPGYFVICWNDPVNLMEYVTHVFQEIFGWQTGFAEIFWGYKISGANRRLLSKSQQNR